jgi:hypothetical protein
MSETSVENTEEIEETSDATASAVSEAPPESESDSPADTDESVSPPPEDSPADSGGTLADDEGDEEDDKPPAWTGNWREIMAGGDKEALKTLNRFKSPNNLYKSYEALRQKMASDMVSRKPENTDDEEAMNAWRAEVGVPETPEGYLERLPDGVVVGEEDQQLVSSFLEVAHAQDFPTEFVHSALGWYYTQEDEIAATQAESDKEARQVGEDTLRADWGPEYRANLNSAVSVLRQYGGEEVVDSFMRGRLADGTPIGNSPEILKFLANVSGEINPAGFNVVNEGQRPLETINTEKAEIEKMMRDEPQKYYADENVQARYRELLEAEEKLKNRGRE